MSRKKSNKQARNWHAVNAHFRNSAGAMKSKRKWDDDERKTTRQWLEEANYSEKIDNELTEEGVTISGSR